MKKTITIITLSFLFSISQLGCNNSDDPLVLFDDIESTEPYLTSFQLVDYGALTSNPTRITIGIDRTSSTLFYKEETMSGLTEEAEVISTPNEFEAILTDDEMGTFSTLVSSARLYDTDYDDITLEDEAEGCDGHLDYSITLNWIQEGDLAKSNDINISGQVCSSSWPESLQDLITNLNVLADKYNPHRSEM